MTKRLSPVNVNDERNKRHRSNHTKSTKKFSNHEVKDKHTSDKKPICTVSTSQQRADIACKLNKLNSTVLQKYTRGEDHSNEILEMFGIIAGKLLQYAFRHDLARVMQCCFRFGTDEMREIILSELAGKMVELTKSAYSSKTVISFLRYGNDRLKAAVLNEFRKNMIRLSTHSCAASVIEFAFSHCDIAYAKTKRGRKELAKNTNQDDHINSPMISVSSILNKLKLELYGSEIALFCTEQSEDPMVIFSRLDLAKQRKALEHLNRVVTKQAEKGILRFRFSHSTILSLITLCEHNISKLEEAKGEIKEIARDDEGLLPEEKLIQGLIPLVTEACLAMISSADGAAAVARCIAHANAKDRKKVAKIIKGHSVSLLFHPYGYSVLVALVSCMDDTVFLGKTIISEIQTPEVIESLIQITLGNNPSATNNGTVENSNEVQPSSGARVVFLQMLAPDNAGRYLTKRDALLISPVSGTSKKDSITRGKELSEKICKSLITVSKGQVSQMLRHQRAADLLVEVLRATASPELLSEIVKCTDAESLEDAVAHRAIKRIISADGARENRENDDFAKTMLEKIGKQLPDLVKINRACFVLAALLEHPATKKQLTKQLDKYKSVLEAKKSAGAAVLVKALC